MSQKFDIGPGLYFMTKHGNLWAYNEGTSWFICHKEREKRSYFCCGVLLNYYNIRKKEGNLNH